MKTRRSFLGNLAGTAGATLLYNPHASAQTMSRQLTIVVPAPPGGATDVMARVLADGMRGRFAQVVLVENRPGAAGRIAAAHVKGAPADGSVMLYTPAFPVALMPHIYKALPYDGMNDFTPVIATTKGGMAVVVGPGVPASVRTLKDFIAWGKAHPKDASFGAPGGSVQHLAGVLFARQAGMPLELIGYKGGAPVISDLLGGHLAAAVNPVPEVLPYAKNSTLRILATTTTKRSRFLPDVPTMGELGYDVVFEDWSGLLAPARTPKDVVARASAAAMEALTKPDLAATLNKIGAELDLRPPEEFALLYVKSWERYRDIVKATGFTSEE